MGKDYTIELNDNVVNNLRGIVGGVQNEGSTILPLYDIHKKLIEKFGENYKFTINVDKIIALFTKLGIDIDGSISDGETQTVGLVTNWIFNRRGDYYSWSFISSSMQSAPSLMAFNIWVVYEDYDSVSMRELLINNKESIETYVFYNIKGDSDMNYTYYIILDAISGDQYSDNEITITHFSLDDILDCLDKYEE